MMTTQHTGALSMIDDDYCVSYTVTMVDVRSCTRPPRSFRPHDIADHRESSSMCEAITKMHIIL